MNVNFTPKPEFNRPEYLWVVLFIVSSMAYVMGQYKVVMAGSVDNFIIVDRPTIVSYHFHLYLADNPMLFLVPIVYGFTAIVIQHYRKYNTMVLHMSMFPLNAMLVIVALSGVKMSTKFVDFLL